MTKQILDRNNYLSSLSNALNNKDRSAVLDILSKKKRYSLTPRVSLNLFNTFPEIYNELFGEYSDCTFDEIVANKYLQKVKNARDRGIEFNLSLTAVKNLLRAKKCYYTGLPLTLDVLTIDRVNSKLGYCRGNVVSCHTIVNEFKAMIESGSKGLNLKQVKSMIKKWEERV